MRIVRVDHIGIAVRETETIAPLLRLLFGDRAAHVEVVADQGVKVTAHRVGETALEFLEGTGEGGPIDRFLAKRGSGLHHVALAVEDLDGAIAELREAGIPLIDETPRIGAEGKRIAFLHPKGTGGILIELSEAPRP